jgi:RimJ/RimL family protein N-acetyltransferase
MPEEEGLHDRGLSAGSPARGGAPAGPVGRSRPMTPVRLADGTQVTLRPIRPEDEPALTALYARLSPQTAYQRFFTVMRRLPPDWAHILANVDYDRRMAVAALGPGDELIGVARYVYDERAQEAEIAIVIEDRWQGRGLGKLLLGELIGYAEGKGIRRFRAYVLADNLRMLKLIGRVTTILERKLDSGVVTLLLAPLEPRPPAVESTGGSTPSPRDSPALGT